MKIAPLLVIRYPGPRFYDTVNVKDLSFDDIGEWRSRGISFQVQDAETGKDVTRLYYLNLAA
jgi:polyhydroxyalkanoate synthesis regulator protein